MDKSMKIGLFGFGCVGQGLYEVLNHSDGLEASIAQICVKDKGKKRPIDMSMFTYNKADLFGRKDLDVIVELIDDADAAFAIVKEAMQQGKSVVTANKKMLAENFLQLYKLQSENGTSLIYEGACAASIPIIRNLEEYYDNELLKSLRGIINGSCNYILSRMNQDNLPYPEALKIAQDKGFAETDPWLDVAGYDAKYKLCLLAVHAFGLILKPEHILNIGIQNVHALDIAYAREKRKRIKLVAFARKVENKFRLHVLPQLVDSNDPFFVVEDETNAVEVEGAFSDKQVLTGKGAGSYPTGSAVLSDISALSYNYKYGYKKLKKLRAKQNGYSTAEHLLEDNYSLRLYIRFDSRKAIEELRIESIEEEYSSSKYNYIIANVLARSLHDLVKKKSDHKLFICIA